MGKKKSGLPRSLQNGDVLKYDVCSSEAEAESVPVKSAAASPNVIKVGQMRGMQENYAHYLCIITFYGKHVLSSHGIIKPRVLFS